MSKETNLVLAKAVLLAAELMEGKGFGAVGLGPEEACKQAAAQVGNPDLALPLELLLVDPLDEKKITAWAKTYVPGWTDSETFVYGFDAGTSSTGITKLVIGARVGNTSVAIASCHTNGLISTSEAELNARRFRAAWNVCQGVSLDALEHMSGQGMNISNEDNIQAIEEQLKDA